jgi:small subunit ribosomal protein S27e
MRREIISVPKPRSNFVSVQCEKCGEQAIVFTHTTADIPCKKCGELIAERSGSKAIILGKVLGTMD